MKLTPVPDPIPGKAYIIVHARTPRVVRLMARASDGSLFYESLPGDNMTLQARCEKYAAYELELPAPVVKLTSQQVADLSHRAGTLIRHIENTRALSVRINDKPLPDDMPEVVALRTALIARYQAELDALLTVGASDAS